MKRTVFSRLCGDRTRGNGFKLKQGPDQRAFAVKQREHKAPVQVFKKESAQAPRFPRIVTKGKIQINKNSPSSSISDSTAVQLAASRAARAEHPQSLQPTVDGALVPSPPSLPPWEAGAQSRAWSSGRAQLVAATLSKRLCVSPPIGSTPSPAAEL